MSTGELAEAIGVSHGRVRQLIAEGRIPSELIARRRVVKRSDLELARSLVHGKGGWPKGKPRRKNISKADTADRG